MPTKRFGPAESCYAKGAGLFTLTTLCNFSDVNLVDDPLYVGSARYL